MYQFFLIICLVFSFKLKAQVINGVVLNSNKQPLSDASIKWLNADEKVLSNQNGRFSITKSNENTVLIITLKGYRTDTVSVTNDSEKIIILEKFNKQTDAIVVANNGILLSNKSVIKTEVLTNVELKKAACCDLAGCFETQSTVQAQSTNIITNAKELRILGLSGVYNQVLIDGFPMIHGTSFTYGISAIPGSFIDNIYISKGANSVLQGFESISGQINVETKKPDASEKLFVNLYMNNFLEKHLNVITNAKFKKWQSLLGVHVVNPSNKIDKDKDNFLDLPLLNRFLVLNKWKYGKEREWGWSSEIAVRLLNENRVGGQTSFNTKKDKGSNSIYGNTVDINQIDFWQKTNYRLNDVHRFTMYASGFQHEQQSYFGTLFYKAKQYNGFLNFQHEFNITKNNTLKSGLTFKYVDVKEVIYFTDNVLPRNYAGNYSNHENIFGVFSENVSSLYKNKLTWIVGFRADKHNNFGWQFTPRTLLKYDPTTNLTLRANIGLGWRTVNFFSENIGLLASSRNIVFAEKLQPEKALNTGFNITQKFDVPNFSGYISADFYHTNFHNQIFPDYDTDPTKAIVKNFNGTSISNGFQTDIVMKWYKNYEIKFGYNFLDVYRLTNGFKEVLPFNAKHKFLTTLSYKSPKNVFFIDMNLHWYGKQRLPNTKTNPAIYQRPNYSLAYTTIAAQVTYNLKKVELYFGCENIFNYRQNQPIISWQNPFSNYFDTSSVWGPTRGREFYLGVRFKIKNMVK
jgi:outer membrane receptor for ferrienterochelin and colicins